MVKNTSIILIIALLLELTVSSCSGSSRSVKQQQRWYGFEFELVNTRKQNSLEFVNDNFRVSFSVNDTIVAVDISNLTNQSIYIHYQRAMIGINNKYYPVGFVENELFMSASLTVPRYGSVETKIAPMRGSQKNKMQPLFKNTDNADSLIRKEILKQFGSTLTLILPMTINGEEAEQNFVLTVKKIQSSFTPDNLLAHRKEKKPLRNKSLVPILIVTTVLGSLLYLNIKNQSPPK
jgi:hypothetical protein